MSQSHDERDSHIMIAEERNERMSKHPKEAQQKLSCCETARLSIKPSRANLIKEDFIRSKG